MVYLSKEYFVGVGPINVGRVEEGDAGIDGVVDEVYHFGLGLWRAEESGHAHTAKTQRRNLQALRAQLHFGHSELLLRRHGFLIEFC